MKKYSLFLLLLLVALLNLPAQQVKFKPGQLQANLGIGLVPTYPADATITLVPPVSVSADVYLSPNLFLGAYVGYSEAKGETTFVNAGITEQYHNATYLVGLRTGIQSNDLDGWRVYGGFLTGASLPKVTKTIEFLPGEIERADDLPSFTRPTAPRSLVFSGFVGTRRYLNDHLSVYGELGFGISLVNLGISFKF
ncbi:MAG: hypothetical protein DA408_19305 [Bacteroidetes bacterium]|nr:MAG: hypothetical protein C7N36_10055 [Bacteroidota bacterium]PTM09023.1 MAG: hypothetical protein DA408_19305 [Bacteroidota bacterium]